MRILGIVFIAGLFFISSCKQNTADENTSTTSNSVTEPPADSPAPKKTEQQMIDEESTEAKYQDLSGGSKKIINERYRFSFEIPDGWKSFDKSNNGDGYFIDCGDKKVDLRVFGENFEGNSLQAQMELKACDRTDRFTFANGFPGIICYQSDDVYYYYDTPNTRITFYIHADKIWQERNEQKLTAIAKSIDAGSGK